MEYFQNTATIVKNGEDFAVDLHLQTTIKDEKRLRVLLQEVLTASGRAEFEVSCMPNKEIARRLHFLEQETSLTIT